MRGDTPMMAGHPPTQLRRLEERAQGADYVTTPLHIAALEGDQRTTMRLLREGHFVDSPDQDLQTPLLLACTYERVACMHALTMANADVDSASATGETPLMAAVGSGNAAAVRLLLDAAARPELQDEKGRTALHCAVAAANEEVVKLLLDVRSPVDTPDENGYTPQHQAAKAGLVRIVTLLKDFKANPLLAAWDGNTALHAAAEKPDPQMLASLVEGTPPDVLDGLRNAQGNNPLHLAAGIGCLGGVELLLSKGMAVDVPGMLLWTALHFAVRSKHLTLIQLLLRWGASPSCVARDRLSPRSYAEKFRDRVGMAAVWEILQAGS